MAPGTQDQTHAALPPVAGLLRRLITSSGSLVQAAAGSVSLVEGSRDRYAKLAERGTSCRLGSSFPLDEGVTGQVVARRRPVVLPTYGQVHAGHLAAGGAAHAGAVLAVPLWWRGDVVGANVVFACRARRFTAAEVDELELLTQSVVPAIVRAGTTDPALAHLLARRGGDDRVPDRTTPSPLTRREQETLVLLARGFSNRQVAGALVLSPKTVEKHVAAVLQKTGAHSRTAAVMTALQRGWLPGR
ncbi:LuxR C-terminal-related transcriptional regulator [Modestobacter sp. VKM Ac-2986]|uniref:LuxR C-terminal-related transcriptional regulator n=1 Tax=Modestobacter sp. VKM Ac-2986 TaxID=3004140 RepID=UPI0022AB7314|nr:LuxR C-terminal-related transcriptional regulator [Modestobacter sp. VKM Ac-2986]MCZ2831094.1 LuxR C-terminal-related transcriptional regulator [Modestobacter sp. VKM Ac-2986]